VNLLDQGLPNKLEMSLNLLDQGLPDSGLLQVRRCECGS
jgi:hypothetical protein